MEAVFLETKRLEYKYSYFLPNSVVGLINNRLTNEIEIDDETVKLLKIVLEFSEQTNYVFDIIKAGNAKSGVTYGANVTSKTQLKLLGDRLIFKNSQDKIDLGGIVKEYAVDVCANILQSFNLKDALIDFGGDIFALGLKAKTPWIIGIKNPKNPKTDILTIELCDKALATSGFYERGGHIVSNAALKYIQTSCIAKSTLSAGIFSTALLANGDTQIPKEIEAIVIDENLLIYK